MIKREYGYNYNHILTLKKDLVKAFFVLNYFNPTAYRSISGGILGDYDEVGKWF